MADSHWTVAEDAAGVRLDKFLAAAGRCGSRARAANALERGKVFVNGTEAAMGDASTLLASGDVVRLWMNRPGSATRRPRPGQYGDLHVVYEDDELIVIDKPPGVLTVPLERKPGSPSVLEQIEDRFRSHARQRALVVHRIDQDTSGLVLFAKGTRAQQALIGQLRRQEIERLYLAVAHGRPDPPHGTWRDHLVWDTKALIQKRARPGDSNAEEAISDYRIVERLRDASLLEVRLRTGRRNQIRIQAALRDHPLVGERRYGSNSEAFRSIPFGRQALHAWRLTFRHPTDGRTMELEAPPPRDFADLVSRLRLRRSGRT